MCCPEEKYLKAVKKSTWLSSRVLYSLHAVPSPCCRLRELPSLPVPEARSWVGYSLSRLHVSFPFAEGLLFFARKASKQDLILLLKFTGVLLKGKCKGTALVLQIGFCFYMRYKAKTGLNNRMAVTEVTKDGQVYDTREELAT